jgi:putative FmdB family regulatory protein
MPVYEYRCFECNSQFEKLGPISERENGVTCLTCGEQAKRLLSTFAAFSSAGSNGETSALSGGCCGGASGGCACRA